MKHEVEVTDSSGLTDVTRRTLSDERVLSVPFRSVSEWSPPVTATTASGPVVIQPDDIVHARTIGAAVTLRPDDAYSRSVASSPMLQSYRGTPSGQLEAAKRDGRQHKKVQCPAYRVRRPWVARIWRTPYGYIVETRQDAARWLEDVVSLSLKHCGQA